MLVVWIALGIIALAFLVYSLFWFKANIEWQEIAPSFAQSSSSLPASASADLDRTFSRKRWWRGVLHFHTTVSPDSKGTFEEARADAKKLGLDFLVSTDHDRMPTSEEYPKDGVPNIIVGQEVFAQHSSGSLIAWNITEGLPSRTFPQPKLHELVKSQGGVDVLIHHPNPKYNRNRHNLPECEYDGFEIINVYDLAITRPFKVIVNWLAALPWLLIGKETDNLLCILLDKSISKYNEISQKRRCTLIGGTDTHIYRRWGRIMLPTYRQGFNLVQNWVYSEANSDLCLRLEDESAKSTQEQDTRKSLQLPNERNIADSFLAGRWIVNLYPQAKQPAAFAAFDLNWRLVGITGDNVNLTTGLKLVVNIPVKHPRAAINIYMNGNLVFCSKDSIAIFEVTEPGVYRAEAYRVAVVSGHWILRKRPWILFNPIYIKQT